jgi:nitrite reductase/ring-hydroxylating ferredoxin subunit
LKKTKPVLVGRTNEFEDLKPVMVSLGKQNVGVYRANGKYYAYLNECAHQGGPACEGGVIRRVKAKVSQSGAVVEEYVTEDDYVIACPWHGVEYSLTTGAFDQDPQLKLKSFRVRLKGDEVFLVV